MMKKSILFMLIFLGWTSTEVMAEQPFVPVFSYNAQQVPVPNSKYIRPLGINDDAGPRVTIRTYTTSKTIPGIEKSCSIMLSRFEENPEPEFYNIITILPSGGEIYRIKQDDLWMKLPKELRQYTDNDYFITAPLKDRAIALLFIGRSYANDPGQLTIIVISNNSPQLVFNRLVEIQEIHHPTGLTPFRLKGRMFGGKTIWLKAENGVLKIQES